MQWDSAMDGPNGIRAPCLLRYAAEQPTDSLSYDEHVLLGYSHGYLVGGAHYFLLQAELGWGRGAGLWLWRVSCGAGEEGGEAWSWRATDVRDPPSVIH